MSMKHIVILVCFIFVSASVCRAQSKKEVKKNNIRSTFIVDTEGGKKLSNKKTEFDKTGETTLEVDYDKDGTLKATRKYKYNKSGDVIEEEEIDEKTKQTEKRQYSYK